MCKPCLVDPGQGPFVKRIMCCVVLFFMPAIEHRFYWFGCVIKFITDWVMWSVRSTNYLLYQMKKSTRFVIYYYLDTQVSVNSLCSELCAASQNHDETRIKTFTEGNFPHRVNALRNHLSHSHFQGIVWSDFIEKKYLVPTFNLASTGPTRGFVLDRTLPWTTYHKRRLIGCVRVVHFAWVGGVH